MLFASKYTMLEDISLFGDFTKDEMHTLVENCAFHRTTKNTFLYQEDEKIKNIYILIKGSVKQSITCKDNHEIIKGIHIAGELIGENIFNSTSRTASAITIEDCQYFALPISVYYNLLAQNSDFRIKILEQMMSNLSTLRERANNYIHKNAHDRIVVFLKKMNEKYGFRLANGEWLLHHKLSHSTIANMTDTSRQTVARVLNDLKSASLINFTERRPNKLLISKQFLS